MKYLALMFIVMAGLGNEITRIARINALKKEAKEAYLAGDYQKAIENYQYLVDSFDVKDDMLMLNLSSAYYKINDTTNAVSNYESLLESPTREVRSIAYQQLGIIKSKNQKYKEALQDFKQSLKANPANGDARYNYELLKKLIQEQEQQQQQQQQNKDQQQNKEQQEDQQKQKNQKKQEEQQDQQNQQNQEGEDQQQQEQQEGQEKEEETEEGKEQEMPSTMDKLKEMNISEEKARMILEAMKNNEIQYIQQNKRKAKNRKKSNKPDW